MMTTVYVLKNITTSCVPTEAVIPPFHQDIPLRHSWELLFLPKNTKTVTNGCRSLLTE